MTKDMIERLKDRYKQWVTGLKKALAELPQDIRRRVAFENAERLLAKWKGTLRR